MEPRNEASRQTRWTDVASFPGSHAPEREARTDVVDCHFLQIPVDILEGVTDAQARQMAEDLEFKGPARNEVRCVYSLYAHVPCHSRYMVV